MNLKCWKIINILGIFLLSSLFHFIYDWFPSFFTSLFFPINESIWEHNKIIILSFFVFTLFEKLYYKKSKSCLFYGFISASICAILVMVIFSPIYFLVLKTQDNIFITLIIYFISICIAEFFSYKLLKDNSTYHEHLGVFLWSLIFIINGILTYYPINIPLFIDYTSCL